VQDVAQITKRRTAEGTCRYDVRTRIGGRVVTKTFPRRKDADVYANSVEADRYRGVAVDPRHARMDVATLARTWEESNPHKRPTTAATDHFAIEVHVIPSLGNKAIGSVTPPQIQALVNNLSCKLSARTVIRVYGVVRAIFNFAVASDFLGRTPCRNIKLPKVQSSRRHDLSPEQVGAILAAMPDEFRPMVALGAVLGLRWGEVAGLRVGRVDILGRQLQVEETVGRNGEGRLVLGPPKSAASRTVMTMPEPLAHMLAEYMAKRGLTAADRDAFLFVNDRGGPLLYSNWRTRIWVPTVKAAGCEGVGFHDLRRATATGLVADGVDIKTAQNWMRHADPRMTLGLYASADQEAGRRAAKAMGERFLGRAETARAMDAR
jgi:integrase